MTGVPPSGSGHSPKGEAAISVASPAKPSVPNAWPLMGYAPGSYMGKCRVCEETQDNIDKRAWQCLECAVREAKRVIEMLSERELELLRKVENYGNLIAYLASDTHDVKPDAIRTLARNALDASVIEAPSGVETGNTDSTEGESAAPSGETPRG